MKKIYGFAAICAAMTLASCSNNDEPNVVPTGEMKTTYLAVSISNPDDTRADDNARTDVNESLATSGAMILFDASGNRIGGVFNITIGENDWKDGTGNVDKVATVLAVTQPQSGNKPANLIMVLNPSDQAKTDLGACTSISDAYGKMYNYLDELNGDGSIKTAEAYAKSGTFMMSNAVWRKDNVNMYAQSISETYNTPEDALLHPTEVYVERIAARVDVKQAPATGDGAFVNNQATVKYGISSTATPLKIVIKNVEVANMANQSSLLKSIEGIADNFFTNWNVTNQSHWAAFQTPDRYNNKSYNQITNALSTSKTYFYTQENTTSTEANYTSVLVTAELQDNSNNPVSLVRIMNNKLYYTEDDAATTLMGYLATKFYVYDSAKDKYVSIEYNSTNKDNFKWVSALAEGGKGYDGYLQLDGEKFTEDVYVPDGNSFKKTNLDALNTELKKYTVWRWNGGKCYYYSAIKASEVDKIGVVRNHIYDITINSIAGLGVPVFDPDEKIVPVTPPNDGPSTDWYLGTKINILKWTKYTQGMDFTQGNGNYSN